MRVNMARVIMCMSTRSWYMSTNLTHSHLFVDFYALGVILYEIIVGERPYLGKTRKEIKEKILQK